MSITLNKRARSSIFLKVNPASKILEQVGATSRVRLRASRTHVHANLTSCIVFGRERSVSVESASGVIWGDAVLVDANWAHIVNFHGGAVDVIYLEPDQSSSFGARPLSNAAKRILEDQIDCWTVESAGNLVDSLGYTEQPRDPAIFAIQQRIDIDPMLRLSEIEASCIARLERTTMLRRFKRQTGMTFRAYKNWSALKHAAGLIGAGEQFGNAGLDSGFADAAHFSRQFRATFGFSPTEARNCVL
ncbi:MAG: AraC family transcriptional regulator [Stagnimonas sp.]|nr:AraC family transcriptional regulator [Stagnimonas sp.]